MAAGVANLVWTIEDVLALMNPNTVRVGSRPITKVFSLLDFSGDKNCDQRRNRCDERAEASRSISVPCQ